MDAITGDARPKGGAGGARDDLDGWLEALWSARRLALAAMLLAALTLGGALAFLRLGIPSVQTFQNAVKFVFPKADKSTYPNGNRFALTDLVAPEVLSRVYTANKLSEHGITQQEFAAMVGVRPYSAAVEEAAARYRDRMSDRRLTFLERREIEQEMIRELESLTTQSAILSLTASRRAGIPETLGSKLLADLASAWATVSIEQNGVLDLPEALDTKPLVDLDNIRSSDFPVALFILGEATSSLMRRIQHLATFGLSGSVVDKSSGHTSKSLTRAAEEVEVVNLASMSVAISADRLVRSRPATDAFFRHRIASLEIESASIGREIATIERALQELREPRVADSIPSGGAAAIDNGRRAADTMDRVSAQAQLGDRFLDRLVGFIEKSFDKEGRIEARQQQQRLRDTLARLSARAIEIDTSLARVKSSHSRLTPVLTASQPDTMPPDKAQALTASLLATAEKLNTLWQATARLYGLVSPRVLSYQGRLYEPVVLPRSERYSVSHPLFNWRILALFLAGTIGTGLLALAAGMLWHRLRNSGSDGAGI